MSQGSALKQTKVLEDMQRGQSISPHLSHTLHISPPSVDTIQGLVDIKQIIKSSHHQTTPPQLPPSWEEHFSDTHGIPYYHNSQTGESSWEFPVVMPSSSTSTSTNMKSSSKFEIEFDDFDEELTVNTISSRDQSSTHPPSSSSLTTAAVASAAGVASVKTASSTSSISSSSSHRRVEDNLMRKGQHYLQHREEMKRESDERLLSEHTGKPQLSKYTERIFANRSSLSGGAGGAGGSGSLSIGERTKIQLERKRMKEETLKRELELKMSQEVRQDSVE
jgi:hypothetical protein